MKDLKFRLTMTCADLGQGRAVGLSWGEDPHVGRHIGEEGEPEGQAAGVLSHPHL